MFVTLQIIIQMYP